MIKRFTYIVLFMSFLPALSRALAKRNSYAAIYQREKIVIFNPVLTDTTKTKRQDDKSKIKEIGKAKRQPKPEKLDEPDDATDQKVKPKRQRRPEGLERPPEIPRRNGGG